MTSLSTKKVKPMTLRSSTIETRFDSVMNALRDFPFKLHAEIRVEKIGDVWLTTKIPATISNIIRPFFPKDYWNGVRMPTHDNQGIVIRSDHHKTRPSDISVHVEFMDRLGRDLYETNDMISDDMREIQSLAVRYNLTIDTSILEDYARDLSDRVQMAISCYSAFKMV